MWHSRLPIFVGPEGTVVGVDVNPDILKTAQARVDARRLYQTLNLLPVISERWIFQTTSMLLLGRLVLMYMADPADALRHLATRLRPRGIAAFQEVDFTPYTAAVHPDTPLANTLIEWGRTVFERSGAHLEMGMDLYKAFVDAGLPEPTLHFEAPMGGA